MCSVPGCMKPPGGGRYAASFTMLCERHRSRDRRHGDPHQEPILAAHLKPYLASLQRRQALHPEAAAWAALEARWMGLVAICRDTIRVFESGLPCVRWDVEAAKEIEKVAVGVTPAQAWRAAAAVVMLREAEPSRFASERAFRTQLGRRVRQLVLSNRSAYWNPGRGRSQVVYSDPSPRGAVVLGDLLTETFGVAGVYLARQDQAEADARAVAKGAFYAALKEVAPGTAA